MVHSQKQSHLESVTEEQEDDCQKDSKTKDCFNEQFQKTAESDCFKIEVTENQKSKENSHMNIIFSSLSQQRQQSILKQSNSQQEQYPKCNIYHIENATPVQVRKSSFLSQQLSQIKIDKQKEAEEQRELMKLIESVDPVELIPKLKSIEIYDEQKQTSTHKDVFQNVKLYLKFTSLYIIKKQQFINFLHQFQTHYLLILNFIQKKMLMIQVQNNTILIFSDKQQIVINEQDEEQQLMDSPNKSEWYESSSVEYRATSYNTNESSNLDHHSYKWKSSSFGDDNIIQDCGFQFQSSVFDFPFPEDFCANSQNIHSNIQNIENKNQHTPKKKRLYCNNKKVPHWAENLE